MAKLIKTYEVYLGDYVQFRTIDGTILCGTVQDISEFPDLFVETGDPRRYGDYKRYRISVNMILQVFNNHDGWKSEKISYEDQEPLEYVWSEDFKDRIMK